MRQIIVNVVSGVLVFVLTQWVIGTPKSKPKRIKERK